MTLFWKSAAALTLTIAGLGATAIPAQAQYHGSGYRDGWRGDRGDHRWNDRRRDDRRWDDRRGWRGDRRYYNGRDHYRGYRQRCWNEWRYDRYRDRRVRVRICR